MADDPIRGRTIRWTYEDGPTKGKTFEHTFGRDGRVSYRMLDGKPAGTSENGSAKTGKSENGSPKSENPKYEVAPVTDDVYTVAYLAPSGYTLTSVLDLDAGTIVSIASNEKELVVQRGTFEVLELARR
jgi:molybdenum cofactor biosynthesis protein MoaF